MALFSTIHADGTERFNLPSDTYATMGFDGEILVLDVEGKLSTKKKIGERGNERINAVIAGRFSESFLLHGVHHRQCFYKLDFSYNRLVRVVLIDRDRHASTDTVIWPVDSRNVTPSTVAPDPRNI